MNGKRLSIIIVNYNVRPFLENALVSLIKASAGIATEIFVVDNASDDGSVEMVRTKFPQVTLIPNERNLGFAAANNLALKQCTGNYLLLINPDTVVQEDSLRVMIGFFDDNKDVGLAGCKVLNPDGTLQLACRRSFPTPWVAVTKIAGLSTLFANTRMFGRYNLTYLDPNESYEVDAVSGSFMFLRRKVYEQIGGLDEQFFMYGEDLDWCYRIQRAGWKNYYISGTQIIHYKGESTKRSDVDEVRLFYEAMHLFVKKHLSRSWQTHLILRIGIAVRSWIASLLKISRPLPWIAADSIGLMGSLLAAEYLRIGDILHYPDYAYPYVFAVPILVLVSIASMVGCYTLHRFSSVRAAGAIIVTYTILSALTFFFKEYAFSRVIVLYSGMISFAIIPMWRVIMGRISRSGGRRGFWGNRTLIVGTGQPALEVLQKLRSRLDGMYSVVGFVDVNRQRIGEQLSGVEILGSIDNIGKVVREHRISEVIFSTDSLSYMQILSAIGRSRDRTVSFRLVPSSLEVIIGKTSIDQLDDLPLVEIDYNIAKPSHRLSKRLFDIIVGTMLLVIAYPVALIRRPTNQRSLGAMLRYLPKVLRGELSLVGPPLETPRATLSHDGQRDEGNTPGASPYLGKTGLTGLVQLNYRHDITPEEIEKYNLSYAKNQSIVLDTEILLKAFLHMFK